MKLTILISLTLLLCSCAITDETHLVVGNIRPAISPDEVKLYVTPPEKYEVIALVSADAKHAFMSQQRLLDIAIKNLRIEAAKVGANGILLDNAGSLDTNSVGMIASPGVSSGAPAIAVGTSSNNVVGIRESGKAIYVFGGDVKK